MATSSAGTGAASRSSGGSGRPRLASTDIQTTIAHPGTIKINVEGAFIVDDGSASPELEDGDEFECVHEDKDIRLPNHTAVVSHVAVDIGGSLAKLVYFTREPPSKELGGRLNFVKFETDKIDDCIEFMHRLQLKHQRLNGSTPSELRVMATGGGAYKYYDKIKESLGVEVLREDEMECLIIGLDFFITEIPSEVFTYNDTPTTPAPENPLRFTPPHLNIYPYLLVNIGSGVSMIKVSGPRAFARIGGTSLGGGTLWGLLALLTGARTFDEMLALAEKGDNAAVDMLVGDIYGADYGRIGLKSSAIASSFGKVLRTKREAERAAEDGDGLLAASDGLVEAGAAGREQVVNGGSSVEGMRGILGGDNRIFKPEDISRSLLYAVSNNIGQIAYLQSEKHNLEHIYFGGSFIRGHRQTINTLSYAIKFWSKGEKQAYFLRHEGYLGAVGAFLKRQPRNWGRRNSFEEARES
ncbi:MAG: hypothetical protein M1821_001294 [Bathelium mastoideum]|nr:MAG: hypothetical protein M1821_001294 [Bathelium mastoideum]KAI9689816.1 MAG: hypothetical protein M1822_009698 [Bathelium mastoideum]